MEKAYIVGRSIEVQNLPSGSRVYFGHETCENLIPEYEMLRSRIREAEVKDLGFSLVMPFLSQRAFSRYMDLVEKILGEAEQLEVICNDWGALGRISQDDRIKPVLGRLLAGQQTDPRYARIVGGYEQNYQREVMLAGGRECALRHVEPGQELVDHYRRCSAEKKETAEFLLSIGVKRVELSNIPQGLELDDNGLQFSLHVDEVLLAAMRQCPAVGEAISGEGACVDENCDERVKEVEWKAPGFPVNLIRRANALYYGAGTLPENLEELPVDRLVFRNW